MTQSLMKTNLSLAPKSYGTITGQTLDTFLSLGEIFAESGFFQDSKGKAQCVVKMMAGAALGFDPITSMTGIHIIKGKISLSANLIAAAIQRTKKYSYKPIQIDNSA